MRHIFCSFTHANLTGAKLESAALNNADLDSAILTNADLVEADLTGASLAGANLLYTDLRYAKNLTSEQLQGANSPLLCNVALPKRFTVNSNRDCDRMPQALLESYPKNFKTLKEAEAYVNQWRQTTLPDDASQSK